MERFLDGWRRLDGWAARVEEYLVVAGALVMVGAVFGKSVLRFGFDRNLFGAMEVATVLLVWVGFLSASLATRNRRHIMVDAIPKLLGQRRAAFYLSAATTAITAVFVGYLTVASVTYIQSGGIQYQRTPSFNLPKKYVALALPVATSLFTVRFAQLALEDFAVAFGWYPYEKRRTSGGIDELIEQEASAEEAPVDADGEGP